MTGPIHIDAVDALREAVGVVGLGIEGALPDSGQDHFVLTNPAGGLVLIEAKRMALVSVDGLARRIAEWNRAARVGAVGLVIADRVTQEAREVLRAAGWGWLDLRGHLHIAGQGMFVDADIPAMRTTSERSASLAGRVGVEVAALLLLNPAEPVVVRRTADLLGRAPSSVSEVLSRMRDAGLLDAQRRPAVPDLFWELAGRWRSSEADVGAVPVPGGGPVNDALKIGFENVEHTTGWALSDTVAAAAYGAGVGVRSDHPRDFYVPDPATLRRAVRLLGPAGDHGSRAATVRVAPVPMICACRVDAEQETWPLAQPLFVALDLAQDPGRGREILADWQPPGPWRRVW